MSESNDYGIKNRPNASDRKSRTLEESLTNQYSLTLYSVGSRVEKDFKNLVQNR